jgi:hypothetical protein
MIYLRLRQQSAHPRYAMNFPRIRIHIPHTMPLMYFHSLKFSAPDNLLNSTPSLSPVS